MAMLDLRCLCVLLIGLVCAAPAAAAPALTPVPGEQAPALSLRTLDGRAYTLGSERGRVVLVNFWATWCEPCRLEMPSIQRLRERLAGKPFTVVAVNVDEP